ncbi:hypothetical protein CCP4SC76_4720007 [Gammaproteobacteria bacterium]
MSENDYGEGTIGPLKLGDIIENLIPEIEEFAKEYAQEQGVPIEDIYGLDSNTFFRIYDEVKKKNKTPKPTIPQTPGPFIGKDEADAPNNPPLNYGLVCVANGGKDTMSLMEGWEANQYDGTPVKVQLHIAGYDSTFRATIDTRDREAPELWAVVKRFSPLHSQLAAYVLTKLGDKSNKGCFPFKSTVDITMDELLDIKGIGRRGQEKEPIMQEIATAMQDLLDLKLDCKHLMYNGKHIHIPNARMFEYGEAYDRPNYDGDGQTPCWWRVRVGLWADFYFQNNGTYWTVPDMRRDMLALDHRETRPNEAMAAIIGITLLTIAGGTRHREGPVTYRVDVILSKCGYLLKPEHRGVHWAGRTRDRLEGALEELIKVKKLAAYSFGDGYPEPNNRGRGWVELWLGGTVTMTTMEAAAKAGQPIKEPVGLSKTKRKTRIEQTPIETGEPLDKETADKLGAAYRDRGWNQERLGKQFKLSQGQMSKVLNRSKSVTPELATRIKAFLDSPL